MIDFARLGYFLHPTAYDPPLGHAGLDVYLFEPAQRERFFDAALAVFNVFNNGQAQRMHVTHPALRPGLSYQVLPGRFFLQAHDGDRIEGICFGGEVAVDNSDGYTVCHLTSPAPIFDFADAEDAMAWLDVELEAELARLRAQWHGTGEEFDAQLATLEPQAVFVAALEMIRQQWRREQAAYYTDEVADDLNNVQQAMRALRNAGKWPAAVPALRELMGMKG